MLFIRTDCQKNAFALTELPDWQKRSRPNVCFTALSRQQSLDQLGNGLALGFSGQPFVGNAHHLA